MSGVFAVKKDPVTGLVTVWVDGTVGGVYEDAQDVTRNGGLIDLLMGTQKVTVIDKDGKPHEYDGAHVVYLTE